MAVLYSIGMGTIDGVMFLYLKQLGESNSNSRGPAVPYSFFPGSRCSR